MAISNPDRVVTKQDLANFYGEILPYLGGMPEMLANKLSKGDIYSTKERIVGQWVDGKPLYQKTIQFTIATVPSSGTANTNLLFPGDNLEIKNIYGYANWNTGSTYGVVPIGYYEAATNCIHACYYKNSGMIVVTCAGSWFSQKEAYLTVQYTKTTDSATSMGDETDYSTTEKIIGTWIDGKPLYQKTMDCGTMPSSATTKDFSHGISNIDYIVSINGFYRIPTDSNKFSLPLSYVSGESVQFMQAWANKSVIRLFAGQNRSTYHAYVTLQYTKTTD